MDAKRLAKYEARAKIIKAMAHPARLLIVDELSSAGERCVCELTEMIGSDMSTVSRHLTVLKGAGLVEDENRSAASSPFLAPAAIVLLSVLVVVAATRAPFRTDSSEAAVRVIVDHVDEAQLRETGSRLGDVESVVVTVDGVPLETRDLVDRGRRSIGFEALATRWTSALPIWSQTTARPRRQRRRSY